MPDTMTPLDEQCWRQTYRDGVLRHYSDAELASVRSALLRDDASLVQLVTVEQGEPPADQLLTLPMSSWPVIGVCLLSWPDWQAHGVQDAGDLDVWFHLRCQSIDEACGTLAAKLLVDGWDLNPRPFMRAVAFSEVEKESIRRAEARSQAKEGERCEIGGRL
jgi:hypothetical protein